jgi:cysteine synthase A
MTQVLPDELGLTLTEPLPALPDESIALTRYPALTDFRARLGDTPLLEVPGPDGGALILAKCEYANPFGSVKDRAAYGLLCAAVEAHDAAAKRPGAAVQPLKLLDFSGGNFALALAGLGELTGLPIRLAVPDAMPPSVRGRLTELGVRIELVPAERFLYGIVRRALEIAAAEPDWTMLHQMRNMANVAIHEHMTGEEIVAQLGTQLGGTRPWGFVATIGTGGTLAGVGRRLRRAYGTRVRLVGVSPRELPFGTTEPPNKKPKFAGSGGLGYGLRQPFVDHLADGTEHRFVTYPRATEAMARFRELTGTRIGASAAANWIVAQEFAATLPPDQVVVTLFADAGLTEEWDRIGG